VSTPRSGFFHAEVRKIEELAGVGTKLADLEEDLMTAKPRIGYRMRELVDIVSGMPGVSRNGALRAAELPVHGLGSGRSLNLAIGAGLIIEDRDNRWVRRPAHALFASVQDRAIFNLRQELLKGNPSPERAKEILAEVEELRQDQAVAYASAQVGAGQ